MRASSPCQNPTHRYNLLLGLPTTVLFAASIGFAIWLLFAAAERLNAVSFEGERRVAKSVVEANVDRLVKVIADYAFWDQMYDQFYVKYDPQWSADNLDQYSIEAFGLDAVLVVDTAGAVRYNYAGSGKDHKLPVRAADNAELKSVVSAALAQWVPGEPGGMAGVITIGGSPFMVAAAAIAPNTEARVHRTGRPQLAMLHLVGLQSWIETISRGFGLSGFEFVAKDRGFIALPNAFNSTSFIELRWAPRALGSSFLQETLPLSLSALLVGGGVFALATVFWVLIARRLSLALLAANAASEAKSEFLALMSHEIRTPLNGVLGMTNALLENHPTAEQRRGLETLRGSGESLLRIINDVLDFSKLEAGRFDIEIAPFDLTQALRHTVEICTPRANEKGVSLEIAIADDVPAYGRGDAGRMRQVLLNIISNAVKFTPAGSVFISACVRSADRDRFVLRVDVRDTGIGIEADKLPILFERFSQADASISRRFGGTGLGLAICQKLVARMGGSIGVESTLGEGSTFWFEIPLQLATPDEVRAIASATEHGDVSKALRTLQAFGRNVRLLLVEDNSTNQLVAKLALEKLGIRPDIAANGFEALDAMHQRSYDIILMDMHMPEMDGIEATKAIRALPDSRAQTPIVALTANAFASDVARCLDAGMNGHVSKPFGKEQLAVAIANILTGGQTSTGQSILAPADDGVAVPIDLSRLRTFKAENGDELLQVLLNSFLDDATNRLHRLAALLGDEDSGKEQVRIAHTLKSAGAMAGASAFSKTAAALEQKLSVGGAAILAADLDSLRAELAAYESALVTHGLAPAA